MMHPVVETLIAFGAVLGHGYFWVALVNRLHGWNGPRKLIDFLTLACCLGFVAVPPVILWYWWQHGREFLVSKHPSLPFAVSQSAMFLLAFIGLGNVLARILGGLREDDPRVVHRKHRSYPQPHPPLGPEVFYGMVPRLTARVPGDQSLQLTIDTKQLVLPRLPKALAGLRIVHISDLHVTGLVGPEWFNHVAQTVTSLAPDVIAVTGDLIESAAHRAWLQEFAAGLQARLGVYFILGNHDLFVDCEQTVADLQAAGWRYLGGRSERVQWNGVEVLLAGNEAPWFSTLPTLPAATDADEWRLALIHTPDQFDWACQGGADLALAGHTHGGQICFPILGAVAVPSIHGTRFAVGTFCRGRTVMHVTRGISGETPFRWLCPPEIAVLELTREA